ncbi:hypothetical protein ACFO0S_10710 [Chryseomicrobium palamuruense]|uniref:Peptidoglycan peptidase n=1 Tax=Chryseomicrobium palamuruense TaxID=682973 RepID=A0ABV8UW04_9BACL
MNERFVYILLTDTGTVFTKTIKTYTKAPYNHSSLALDSDLIQLYSFGRKKPNNPFKAGFVQEDVVNGTYKKYPQTTCALYEVPVSERQYQKICRMLELFKKNNQKTIYNLMGVFGVAVKAPFEPQGSYFCSQFVAEILHKAGVNLWTKLPALIEPNDFREAQVTKLVYEGLLNEYPPVWLRSERT